MPETPQAAALASPSAAPINPFDTPQPEADAAPQTAVPMRPQDQLSAPGNMAPAMQNALANPVNGVPLKFNDKLHANSNASAEAMPPAERAKPGSWARQLVAGAQSALSTIGETQTQNRQHPGESIFETANRVKDANQQKAQQQQKATDEHERNMHLNAKTNVDTIYQETLLHSLKGQIADKANAESEAYGNAAVKMATVDAKAAGLEGATIKATGVPEEKLPKGHAEGSWNATGDVYWHTGDYQPIDPTTNKPQVDADGNPVKKKLYTIISVPEEIKLTESSAKFLNDNLGTNQYKADNLIPGALGMNLYQQAMNTHAQQAKIESDRNAAKLADMTTDQKLASAKAVKDMGPEFLRIQAHLGSLKDTMDYVTGQHIGPDGKPDQESHKYKEDHPDAARDLMNAYGGFDDFTKRIDTEEKDAQTAREKHLKDNAEKAPKTLGDAVGILGQAQNADRAASTPETKQAVESAMKMRDTFLDADAAKSRVEEAAKDGNPDVLAEGLVSGDLAWSQIVSTRKPEFAVKAKLAADKLSQKLYGKPFSAQVNESNFKQATNPQVQMKLKMIEGMTEPGGSIEIAQQATKALPQLNSNLLNKVFNATETEFGSPEATNFHTAMLGLADEYSQVMGTGGGSDVSRQQALDILKAGYSKKQLTGAVDIMRRDIEARKRGLVGKNPALQALFPDYRSEQQPNPGAPVTTPAPKVPGTIQVNPNAGAGAGSADFFSGFGGRGR
jgi:hypothetical protein